jgi:predicted dehydrogenase
MKILIAGFGSIGRRHFQNLLSLGEKDILFYRSRKSTLPDEILSGFQVEKNLEKALAQKPDAVVVSNPTALHLDVAIPAARQGCHILLEKPISNSMDRIDELKKAVKVSGSRILVGFQFRYHPGLLQIKEWIQHDKIGSIYYVRTHWGEYLPDWHPWEDYHDSYSARKELGGGVLLTLSHPIDYLRWISAISEWDFGRNASKLSPTAAGTFPGNNRQRGQDFLELPIRGVEALPDRRSDLEVLSISGGFFPQ